LMLSRVGPEETLIVDEVRRSLGDESHINWYYYF